MNSDSSIDYGRAFNSKTLIIVSIKESNQLNSSTYSKEES